MSDTGEHESTRGEIIVHVFGRTDVGRTREHNEDAFLVADLTTNQASLLPQVRQHKAGPKGSLFMVADGMGGAAAGEIASQMATEIVIRELRETWIPLEEPSPEAFARCLKRAAQNANQQIHGYATSHTEYRGMGTTATIAGLLGDTLYLAQIGDSRAYLVRNGEFRQITKDQSLMQKLIEAGELTEEEAAQSERRNIILQALGPEPNIKVDLTYQQLRRGDTLMLCSDGLSGYVSKTAIADVLRNEKDLITACKRLIELANMNGGPDNITCIVARFDGEGLIPAGEDDEVGHRVFSLPEATPPIGMERMSEGPTQPTEGARPTVPVDTSGEHLMDAERLIDSDPRPAGAEEEAEDEEYAEEEEVDERRGRGRLITLLLLALLLGFGGWYAYRTFRRVQPEPTPTTPSQKP
jgi:protein phosphatase